MSEISSMTALVVDGGGFLPLAFRLAQEFGRVMFYSTEKKTYPTLADAVIGDGYDEIERVDDLLQTRKDADVIVIPDVGNSDLCDHLRFLGHSVWGSGNGDRLELDRLFLKKFEKRNGLKVSEYSIVKGITDLRSYLKSNPDVYVKISRFRGDMETFHSINYLLSEQWIDEQAVKWGPLQDEITFIVDDPIDAVIETGYDGICIDGKFPAKAVHGVECKNKAYVGTVMEWEKMPKELTGINNALSEFLRENEYRNFFSSEVRITKDGDAFLTDPTCREASPAGECLLALIENLGEVIVAGARGELIEPKFSYKFAVQAFIDHTQPKTRWRTLDVPLAAREFFTFPFSCQVNDLIAFPPMPWSDETIGTVIGLGNTLFDALDDLKENAAALEGQDAIVHIESLADSLQAIEDAQSEGIPFTKQEIPEPSTVLEK